MRKTIILTVAFVMLATMLPLTEASRYVYHLYSQNRNQSKRYSGRISPYNYERGKTRIKYKTQRHHFISNKAERYRVRPQKVIYTRPVLPVLHTSQLFSSKANQKFSRYKYSNVIPRNFKKQSDGIYKDQNSSLQFRVVQTPEKYKCLQKSFKICAINLGKGFKREQSLRQTYHYFTSYRLNQTKAHSFSQYPILVESFKGTLFGSEHVYFVFNALNPIDDSIIRIEAVVSDKEKTKAAQTMFKIFESFRIKN